MGQGMSQNLGFGALYRGVAAEQPASPVVRSSPEHAHAGGKQAGIQMKTAAL